MGTSCFQYIFRSVLVLSIVLLLVGCGGGGGGGGGDDSGGGEETLSLTLNSPSGNVTINEGDDVTFQVTVSGGTAPYTYEWDFSGGAANSYIEDPGTITFTDTGNYTVTLTVMDAQSVVISRSITVTVNSSGGGGGTNSSIVGTWKTSTLSVGDKSCNCPGEVEVEPGYFWECGEETIEVRSNQTVNYLEVGWDWLYENEEYRATGTWSFNSNILNIILNKEGYMQDGHVLDSDLVLMNPPQQLNLIYNTSTHILSYSFIDLDGTITYTYTKIH